MIPIPPRSVVRPGSNFPALGCALIRRLVERFSIDRDGRLVNVDHAPTNVPRARGASGIAGPGRYQRRRLSPYKELERNPEVTEDGRQL